MVEMRMWGVKLFGLVAFAWMTIQEQARGDPEIVSVRECVSGTPIYCDQLVCPDRCPSRDSYGPGTNETCHIDCLSCSTSCLDMNTCVQVVQCKNPHNTRCYGKYIRCPQDCPDLFPEEWDTAKACLVDCDSPTCHASCRLRKPNCNGLGASCYDPRFVGGDGSVFYFHGKRNQSFSLVSDHNLQINGHFIGHRPNNRPRDFTWIQALGILFNSHILSLEATKSSTWDEKVDHLKFTYNGQDITTLKTSNSRWYSPDASIRMERTSSKNNAMITLMDKVEILVNVVPVTKKDNKIHNYQLPDDDCFAHLEVQFRFLHLSPKVDGVLGRTYKPEFESSTEFGVEMPTFGDHEKYQLPSLFSSDCVSCVFSHEGTLDGGGGILLSGSYPDLNCSTSGSRGYGIMCKK